jgi:hypothetical protein
VFRCGGSSLLPPGTPRSALPDFASGGTSAATAARPLNHAFAPRPRHLPARSFLYHRRPSRLRMHARWPCASLSRPPSPASLEPSALLATRPSSAAAPPTGVGAVPT